MSPKKERASDIAPEAAHRKKEVSTVTSFAVTKGLFDEGMCPVVIN